MTSSSEKGMSLLFGNTYVGTMFNVSQILNWL
ncbi:hypothetical protein FHS70_002417 [Flammeovirga yaeyamensis]|nr:hypothetical protein [Flammeovirga yaeyamensis]